MKQQPGVMLYFDVRESIAQLSYAEKGMLLDAILDYGQHRQEPTFDGVALPLIWPFVRKDIHRDSERYEAMRAQRKAAIEKRWQKENAHQDDTSVYEPIREDTSVYEPIRTIPTTSTPSPSAAAAPPAAAAATETESSAPPPAASSLPRTNGSALPDIVAQYLPGRRSAQEEVDRRRAEAIARLRALPDS